MLLFKFLNERLKELLLCLHLFDFSLDLDSDTLLHPSLMHLVADNLSEELHVAQCTELETSLIEVLTELDTTVLFLDLHSILFPLAEQFLHFV